MKKIYLKTFGCKTNQYDTQAIREQFLKAGYEETQNAQEADLFIVNTCTVTAEADRKGRWMMRKFHRENPEAPIAVTGCYATLNAEEIRNIPGVRYVIPNEEKDQIFEKIAIDQVGKFCGEGDESEENSYNKLEISYFADRTRAFVKIQDGCDHACTYCKVVLVRGNSRSRSLEDVVDEAHRLVDRGYQEIVLTGIQLGAYGDEWKSGIDLATVLEKLVPIPGLERIRMSSVDPSDVTERLIHFMKDQPKVCPQLHLPLQSGDDEVLKRMKRAYRRSHFLDIVSRLRKEIPDFSLTSDVMVGFPGEEEAHFSNTLDVLQQTLPLKIHVFPYSNREGTVSVGFDRQIPKKVAHDRVRKVQLVSGALSKDYQKRFLGKKVRVLVEAAGEDGIVEGHSPHYLKVRFAATEDLVGQIVPVRLSEIHEDGLFGTLN